MSLMLISVVPCVGTWIEIFSVYKFSALLIVVPCVGTWIEILSLIIKLTSTFSRSLCGNVD